MIAMVVLAVLALIGLAAAVLLPPNPDQDHASAELAHPYALGTAAERG